MAWILLEGLDRSGKSTVAEMYKRKGFDVVHMEAPDKKYFQPGYSGPSYLEEVVNMYTIYDGKDVLFDRTIYGECIWPEIFNRQALLTDEDFEYLQRLEYNNDAVKILMYDQNTEAHWQRCVDNNEPINRLQFVQASRLYDKLAQKYNFDKRQLGDFSEEDSDGVDKPLTDIKNNGNPNDSGDIRQNSTRADSKSDGNNSSETLDEKLERANAIRSLLKSSLIKKKGEVFNKLEQDIKLFLEKELEDIFTEKKQAEFTHEEILLLKGIANRLKEKTG